MNSVHINDIELILMPDFHDFVANWDQLYWNYSGRGQTFKLFPRLPTGPIPLKARYVLRLVQSLNFSANIVRPGAKKALQRLLMEQYLRCSKCGEWHDDSRFILTEEHARSYTRVFTIQIRIDTRPCISCLRGYNKAVAKTRQSFLFPPPFDSYA